MLSNQFSKTVLSIVRTTTFPQISVAIIDPTDDSQAMTLDRLFELRYNLNVRHAKRQVYPKNHYCLHNDKYFYDHYDFEPSTRHIIIKKDDNIVAACRMISGRDTLLEAEKMNWYDLREKHPEIGDNFVEPTRIISDKSIRGTFIVPFLYLKSMSWALDNEYEHVIGTVDTKQRRLLNHYQKYTRCQLLNDEPFAAEEFLPNHQCDIVHYTLGKSGSVERNQYIRNVLFPAYLGTQALYYTKG